MNHDKKISGGLTLLYSHAQTHGWQFFLIQENLKSHVVAFSTWYITAEFRKGRKLTCSEFKVVKGMSNSQHKVLLFKGWFPMLSRQFCVKTCKTCKCLDHLISLNMSAKNDFISSPFTFTPTYVWWFSLFSTNSFHEVSYVSNHCSCISISFKDLHEEEVRSKPRGRRRSKK